MATNTSCRHCFGHLVCRFSMSSFYIAQSSLCREGQPVPQETKIVIIQVYQSTKFFKFRDTTCTCHHVRFREGMISSGKLVVLGPLIKGVGLQRSNPCYCSTAAITCSVMINVQPELDHHQHLETINAIKTSHRPK